MTGEEALQALHNKPKDFLNEHRLKVAALFDASGPLDVWLYRDTQNFGGKDSFTLVNDNPGLGDPVEVRVFGVRVYRYADVRHDIKALPPAELPLGDGDPFLMATVQLSGCTIVRQARKSGSGPFIAHIQPDEGQDGKALQEALSGARFAGSTHSTERYGRKDYKDDRATVIAVRKDGGWKVFAQELGASSIKDVRDFSLK